MKEDTIISRAVDTLMGRLVGDSLPSNRNGGENMKLKVFKMREGKLVFAGVREVREGDAILDGDTGMEEITLSESDKGDELNRRVLKGLSGEAKANVKRGLHVLGQTDPEARDALKAAFERLGMTAEAADLAARGR